MAESSGRHSLARGEEEDGSRFTSQPYNDALGFLIGFYTKTLARVHTPSPAAHLLKSRASLSVHTRRPTLEPINP